jgi:hypothetical protein
VNPNKTCEALACVALACLTALVGSARTQAAPAPVTPAAMGRIATVDERFQSYNVEMVEVVGGRFWKPYASGASTPRPAPATVLVNRARSGWIQTCSSSRSSLRSLPGRTRVRPRTFPGPSK